jgi:ribosomal protein L13
MLKPGEIERKWLLVDASDKVVGRLASEIAIILMGKHRPTYTPHIDSGDYVVVVNVDKIHFSGSKWEQKEYRWYTGYPGQKTITAEERFKRHPEPSGFCRKRCAGCFPRIGSPHGCSPSSRFTLGPIIRTRRNNLSRRI